MITLVLPALRSARQVHRSVFVICCTAQHVVIIAKLEHGSFAGTACRAPRLAVTRRKVGAGGTAREHKKNGYSDPEDFRRRFSLISRIDIAIASIAFQSPSKNECCLFLNFKYVPAPPRITETIFRISVTQLSDIDQITRISPISRWWQPRNRFADNIIKLSSEEFV